MKDVEICIQIGAQRRPHPRIPKISQECGFSHIADADKTYTARSDRAIEQVGLEIGSGEMWMSSFRHDRNMGVCVFPDCMILTIKKPTGKITDRSMREFTSCNAEFAADFVDGMTQRMFFEKTG